MDKDLNRSETIGDKTNVGTNIGMAARTGMERNHARLMVNE
jgi:hypothetical protein